MKNGDENMIYFFLQNFVKGCRVHNIIWVVDNLDGGRASSFEELTRMGKKHSSNLYKAPP